MKIIPAKIKILLQVLLRLERQGDYELAFTELESIWEDKTELPNIEGFEASEAAEILLRCGSLIGFEGHIKQISNAQETSKNLLTEAHRRFIELQNIEKIVECENYMALAYWRKGELIEAATWLEQSFFHTLSATSNVRFYSKIIKSLILLSHKKYEELIVYLKNEENNFLDCTDFGLRGDFYNQFAIAHQELGQPARALEYLELAGFYHRKSGHQIYLGTVENNLAQLYKLERKFTKAHAAIDRATEIFKKINDLTREGFSLDTKAQIYFDEGKYDQALIVIEAALMIMQTCENQAYLVETLWTKTKILIYLNDISKATQTLFEAVQKAKIHITEEAANDLVNDFEKTLNEKNSAVANNVSDENKLDEETLKLILPSSIAHYRHIQAVWINSSHLEKFDLPKDSLAVVAKEKVRRGDLTAVMEISTDEVICGFYDTDFGIVCIENGDDEPTLFNESDIKILGKIIGVCNVEENSDGKMLVKPLNFSR